MKTPDPERKQPMLQRRTVTRLLLVLLVFFVAGLIGYAAFERGSATLPTTCDEAAKCAPSYGVMTVYQPWVVGLVWYCGAAIGFVSLVLFVVTLVTRRWAFAAAYLAIAVVVYPVSCSLHSFNSWVTSWHTIARMRPDKGRTYFFMYQSAMQARVSCLTMLDEDGFFTRRMKVLACGDDEDYLSVPIVRKSGNYDTRQDRIMTCGNLILLLNKHSYCAVAFDLKTGRGLTLYPAEKLELSPFVCLGPNDALHPLDLKRYRAWKGDNKRVLEFAKRHSNPRVRSLVAGGR